MLLPYIFSSFSRFSTYLCHCSWSLSVTAFLLRVLNTVYTTRSYLDLATSFATNQMFIFPSVSFNSLTSSLISNHSNCSQYQPRIVLQLSLEQKTTSASTVHLRATSGLSRERTTRQSQIHVDWSCHHCSQQPVSVVMEDMNLTAAHLYLHSSMTCAHSDAHPSSYTPSQNQLRSCRSSTLICTLTTITIIFFRYTS